MKKLILLLTLIIFIQAKDKAIRINNNSMKTEQRVALVIGNSDYQGVLSKLSNPINDAKAIKKILEDRGFNVIYRDNVNKKSMRESLNKFYAKIAKGGVGMFYFSGHGLEVEGQNYLIPIDANIKAKSDTEFEAIALNRITKRMQNAGNRLNIVVLDACRNDPFTKAIGVGGLAKSEPIGLFVSYATGAGEVASDGRVGSNGLFTHVLVKYMQQPLDLQNVFQKTREEVYKASNKQQFPAIYNQIINGKFYFTLPKGGKNEPKINYNISSTKPIIANRSISTTKIKIDNSLDGKISVDSSNKIIKIQNHTNNKLAVHYRVKYFDKDDIEVGEGMSIWQPLFLESDDITNIREIAPVPSAKKCKIYFK